MNQYISLYFSRTVWRSGYLWFLMVLHLFANLTSVVELWADGKDYSNMLFVRLPLGFLAIAAIVFVYIVLFTPPVVYLMKRIKHGKV